MNDQEPALPTRPLDIKSPLWEAMDRQPRHVADAALRFAVPKEIPGVYVLVSQRPRGLCRQG
jgi:hypothetical protein